MNRKRWVPHTLQGTAEAVKKWLSRSQAKPVLFTGHSEIPRHTGRGAWVGLLASPVFSSGVFTCYLEEVNNVLNNRSVKSGFGNRLCSLHAMPLILLHLLMTVKLVAKRNTTDWCWPFHGAALRRNVKKTSGSRLSEPRLFFFSFFREINHRIQCPHQATLLKSNRNGHHFPSLRDVSSAPGNAIPFPLLIGFRTFPGKTDFL